MSEIEFSNKVAIVTGAGNGLGRSHALALAARGAKVVVNDLGSAKDGLGFANEVAKEVNAAGGDAIASTADVTKSGEVDAMVKAAMENWGRIDILVNNAGILRDKTFRNMPFEDFRTVIETHLIGTALCTHAVWPIMCEQNYGRIVMTSSSSGIYGNFGQSNYAAAKMGVIGLMNTLHLEGAKYDIRVNALAPTAATRMTEGLASETALALMTVESVTAGLLFLASTEAPSRLILCAGAGGYAATRIYETDGVYLIPENQTPEKVAVSYDAIVDASSQEMYEQGAQQTIKFVTKAAKALNVNIEF